jgi:hypothetical protein
MALSWRRVSQRPLARSRLCMRQRAHSGLGGPRCTRGELQLAIGAAGAPVRGGCVTRVGRFWIERAYADGLGFGVRAGERRSQFSMRSPGVAVSLNGSPEGKLCGRRPRRLARLTSRRPLPPTGPDNFLSAGPHNGCNRSRVERELALRPGLSAYARMPPTAQPALRGERRGLLVLTAGLVPYYFYGRYPTGPVNASQSDLTACGF